MDNSVGNIALNLVLSSASFNKQLNTVQSKANTASNKISSSFKKIGVAVGAAFSIKVLAKFGKQCINLGSDLSEVQNVVDVTYGKMTDKVDKFSKKAKGQFGLSETMSKKYIGLYGSMAEAFGFSEKESYKMAKGLTGLAGDVASFFNIDQNSAYTKLKSVFSGETETLKDLGIVMTQSALDAFALANGYGKVTKNMTEAEKVSLRYAFVQKQLANANGDFARTADSWANQTRVFKLNIDSLKASLGQSFIYVLKPLVKMMNDFVGSLSSASEKLSGFLSGVFGKDSAAGKVSQELGSASSEASSLSTSSDKAAKSLTKSQKAAKQLKENLAGFDKLNVLNQKDSSSAGSKAPKSGSASKAPALSLPVKVKKKSVDALTKQLRKYLKQGNFEKVGELFAEKLSSGMQKIKWGKVKAGAKAFAHKTGSFINGFFKGFDWNTLGAHVGEGINTAFLTVGTFFKTVKWGLIGDSIAKKFSSMFSAIGSKNVGETLAAIINAPIEYAEKFNYKFDWTNFGKKVETGFTAFVRKINLESAANALSLKLKGIASSSQEIFTSPSWSLLGEKVRNALAGFFDTNPLNSVGNTVRKALGALFDFAVELFSNKNGSDIATSLGKAFGQAVSAFFKDVNWWGKVGKLITAITTGIARFLRAAIKNINVKDIENAIVTLIKSIDWLYIGAEIVSLLFTGLIKVIKLILPQGTSKILEETGIEKKLIDAVTPEADLIAEHSGERKAKVKKYKKKNTEKNQNKIDYTFFKMGINPDSFQTTKKKAGPSIPKFASGGLIKAPTLALVGDNKNARNDPEVVSPLSKLKEMINDGAQSSDSQLVSVMLQMLRMLEKIYDKTDTISKSDSADTVVKIGEDVVFEACRNENNRYKKRHGASGFA